MCIGINISKDNRNLFITNSDKESLSKSFTISNNRTKFKGLIQKSQIPVRYLTKVKVGLEYPKRQILYYLFYYVSKALRTKTYH